MAKPIKETPFLFGKDAESRNTTTGASGTSARIRSPWIS